MNPGLVWYWIVGPVQIGWNLWICIRFCHARRSEKDRSADHIVGSIPSDFMIFDCPHRRKVGRLAKCLESGDMTRWKVDSLRDVSNLFNCNPEFIAAIAVVGVVYKSIQRPDRIVVDMSSGRTVMINDRELGATEAVKLEKDKLQLADMDYVVKAYLDYLYRVDQRSRSKDIEAALRLMVPSQAKKFPQYLTDQKILQTQREQQWNAIWKPEYLEHAPGKPLTVKVYGTQEIDLVVKNESKHLTKHILLTVDLLPDAPEDGTFRLDRNLRSGFRINAIDYKELSSNEAETPVTTPSQG